MLVTRSTLHLRLTTMQESNVTESVQSFNVTMSLDDLNAEEAQIFLPAAIFVSILSVIGVISNIHIILIYGLRMERSNNRNFIIALAILDLITSMLAMPFIVATSILPYKFTDATACKVLAMVSYFSTTASGFILVMIAVDRYRHICRPMGRQMSKTLVTISCLLSVGLAILLTWPSLIFYDVNDVLIKYTNVIGKECAFSSKFRSSSYVRIYNYVLLGVSMILFIILVVLYICIHRSISKHEKYLEKFIIHKPHKSNMRKGFAQSVDTLNDSLFDTTCSHDDTIFTKSEKQYVDSPDSKLKENESSGLKADVYPLRRINTISEEDTREIVEEDTSFNNALQRNLEENEKPLPTSLTRAPYDVNNTSQTKVSNQNGDASLVQVLEQPNKNRERNSFDSVLTDDTNRDGRKYRSESSVRAFFHQKKSTFMFIIITVVFLCGYVFHELLILTVTLVPDIHENMSRSVRSLYYTSLWLVFINNVCNSAIYGYFHRRFREELKEFYRSIFCRN